jgi:hypothetical protein
MPRSKTSRAADEKPRQIRNHTQISMTVDPKVLAEINRFAELSGVSRSVFLVIAAQREIERLKKGGMGTE